MTQKNRITENLAAVEETTRLTGPARPETEQSDGRTAGKAPEAEGKKPESKGTPYRTMKDLPNTEKPDQKCRELGPEVLTDAELLSVILRTGAEGISAVDMSRRILDSQKGRGLRGVCSATVEDLCLIRGVGTVKALQIKCIAELSRRIAKEGAAEKLTFTNPDAVAAYYMEDLRHEEQEHLVLLMLDTHGHLLGEEWLSKGTVNATMISPREIFLAALTHHAVSVIMMHNHPSGDPTPSREDIELTRRVRLSGELLGSHCSTIS